MVGVLAFLPEVEDVADLFLRRFSSVVVPDAVVPAVVVPAAVVPAVVVSAAVVPASVVPAAVVPASVVPAVVAPSAVVSSFPVVVVPSPFSLFPSPF